MVAAVVERNLHIHHLVTREYAALHRFLDALVDRLDVLLGNRSALDVVRELVALARLVRLNTNLRVAVVARTAGLANVLALRLGVPTDGLAIVHLRLADIGLDLVLAHHAVDDDLQVQLAHAGDDGLAGVDVRPHIERRVFLRELGQRHAHLFLVGLGLRLNRNLDNRFRKVDRLQHHRVALVANGVAGDKVLQSNRRADVAGQDLRDLFTLVGVHLQQAADPLRLAGARVQHGVARLQRARVRPDKDKLPDKRVGHDLEAKRRKGLAVVRPAHDLLLHMLRVMANDRRNVQRAGQVVDYRVQQRLHALVLERRAAQHREDIHRDGGLADAGLELLLGGLFPLEIEVHDGVVRIRNGFD